MTDAEWYADMIRRRLQEFERLKITGKVQIELNLKDGGIESMEFGSKRRIKR